MSSPFSPREPPERPPSGGAQSDHGWTARIARLTTLVGLGIGINEARKGQADANNLLILFAAICVLGVRAVEALLHRFIDRLFGDGSNN